jgi:hypothetical protein
MLPPGCWPEEVPVIVRGLTMMRGSSNGMRMDIEERGERGRE